MRYPATHKQDTRARLLKTTGALAKRQGFAGTGVDGLMAAAGLTSGAFYSHFRSKGELLDAIETVEKCAPGLPAHQLAAFADAVFNAGPRIVCDRETSTAARLLAAGDIEAACNQLPRWNRATVAGMSVELPGLLRSGAHG